MSTPNDATYASLIVATTSGTPAPLGWSPVNVQLNPGQVGAGLVAKAYVNATGQVVMTFIGPGTSFGFGSGGANQGAGTTDSLIMNGTSPRDYNAAVLQFVADVKQATGQTDPSNIFAAGNSLGGYAAQYAASKNGFGGASYGGPGLVGIEPSSMLSPVNAFNSYVLGPDPVGNFATDTRLTWGRLFPDPEAGGPGPTMAHTSRLARPTRRCSHILINYFDRALAG